ncbi:MAG: lysylphosphatidylglycerol synthase transmembrane domain-containing protein [Candidatus Saccharimonadales bacterium]
MKASSPTASHHYIRASIVAGIGVLLGVYIWNNWDVMLKSLQALADTSPLFLVAGIALAGLTFMFAAGSYASLALKKLPFKELLVIEFAATAINRLFPSGLGGMGAHGLYLFKRGHSKTAATLVISTNTLLGFLAHNILLVLALLVAPQALKGFDLPGFNSYMLLAVAVLVAVGTWFAVRRGAVSSIKKNFSKTIGSYKRQPSKLGIATLCLMGITITNFTIFMLAGAAVGISLPLVAGFLIYSAGVAVGAATPTPGGLAGVEAGLVAGLLAMNVDEVSAIAAVLAFRFVTFWLPLVPGIVALWYVRRKNLL